EGPGCRAGRSAGTRRDRLTALTEPDLFGTRPVRNPICSEPSSFLRVKRDTGGHRHGQGRPRKDRAWVAGRHRPLLHHVEEQEDEPGKASVDEVRSGGAEARFVQGNEAQVVARPSVAEKKPGSAGLFAWRGQRVRQPRRDSCESAVPPARAPRCGWLRRERSNPEGAPASAHARPNSSPTSTRARRAFRDRTNHART